MFRSFRHFETKKSITTTTTTNAFLKPFLQLYHTHHYNIQNQVLCTSCRLASTSQNSKTHIDHHKSDQQFDIDHYLRTENYDKKRVMVENRTSIWCRRIWELSKKIQTMERQREKQLLLHQPGNSKLNSILRDENNEINNNNNNDTDEAKSRLILSELADVIEEERKGEVLPASVIDTIWTVYDDLFPPRLQYAVNNNINNNSSSSLSDDPSDPHRPGDARLTPNYVNHFFSFIRVLTQCDFNVDGVAELSAKLSSEVEKYKQLQQQNEANANNNNNNNNVKSEDELLKELKLKNKIIDLCFDIRTTGSPLHYIWLRHSAAKEGGTRRLMEFRKTIHFFDIECNKQIQKLRKQKQQTQTNINNNNNNNNNNIERENEVELRFWLDRKSDIATVDASLRTLFHDFFAKEYLVMEELRWYATAPSLLEHVMAAEHVHPFVNGFADFKRRMQPCHHRHCFAFLHPSVIEEPLIAVQVALTREIMSSVDVLLGRPSPLLDVANKSKAAVAFRRKYEKEIGWYRAAQNQNQNQNENSTPRKMNDFVVNLDPYYNEDVNTAIFYSINSAQSALRGMDMGNLLIKRVVQEVQENINLSRKARHLPPIEKYSTLSPIPGYTRWLSAEVEKLNARAGLLEANNNNNSDQQKHSFLDANPFGAPTSATNQKDGAPSSSSSSSSASADQATEAESFYAKERALYAQLRAAVLRYGRAHLANLTEDDQHSVAKLQTLEDALLAEARGHPRAGGGGGGGDAHHHRATEVRANAQACKFLVRLLLAPDPNDPWYFDAAFTTAVEAPLLASVAHYLLREKKRGRCLDPVGNFHIANGAMVRGLNFLANATPQGSRESGTVMVNYHYEVERIGARVSAYALRRELAAAAEVEEMLLK